MSTQDWSDDTAPRTSLWESREVREVAPWWSSAITAENLGQIAYPPLTYLVDGVLVAGALTTLAGAPKAGKSVLATSLCLGVAQGGRALGTLTCQQGDVLMVALDDTSRARLQRRLHMVNGPGVPLPPSLTLHTEPIGVGEAAADALDYYLTRHPDCRLVALDTVEHLRPAPKKGQNPYGADVTFMATLRQVTGQHPSVSILGLAHTRKVGTFKGEAVPDDPISAVTGTHGLTGGTDAVMVLAGGRGVPLRTLAVVSRDAEDTRLTLRWSPAGLVTSEHDPDDPTLSLTADDARVYRAVQDFGGPVTARDLEPLLPGVTKVGNRLAALEKRGLLVKVRYGVYRLP